MLRRVVLVIAPDKYREEELFNTLKELEDAGIHTMIASKKIGTCIGQVKGTKTEASISLGEIKVEDYDGIVFVGGFGASIYFNDSEALELAKAFYSADKIIAAICIAPSILANAGLIKGKKVTAYESEKENIEKNGGIYTGNTVEEDEKIITGNGPDAAHKFGKIIAKHLL